MQKLIPGIKTFLGAADSHGDRIRLSTGTLCVPRSYRHEDEAIIPAPPWRKPASREMAILTAGSVPEGYDSAISVVSLPTPLLHPFEALRAAAAKGRNKDQINEMLACHCFDGALRSVIQYVDKHLRPSGEAGPAEELKGGIFAKPAAQCTITTDPNSSKLVGLHADNWSNYPIDGRAQAPNRIAFNLGCEDRFFLFVNIPVHEMYEKVRHLIQPIDHTTAVGRMFMVLFPSYPVVR
jgi:hypothetical protein